MRKTFCTLALLAFAAFAQPATATIIEFDFQGNAGLGLLPGNEVGANTPIAPGAPVSNASGDEFGDGLVYNTVTNTLEFDFVFSNLSGGLADVASGIHFHDAAGDTLAADPFNTNGPIALNVNSGTDPDVTLTTDLITNFDGSVINGRVSGSAVLTDLEEENLLNGDFYLNIHSGTFGGGELRGNLVQAVPEPAALSLLGLAVAGLGLRRRR